MKVVFSRKGMDSTDRSGKGFSLIRDGKPVPLPIKGMKGEKTTYAERGLAGLIELATRENVTADMACHDDPMFSDGYCWLGQEGTAQRHLMNQEVGVGDVFLFFGRFNDEGLNETHHRIFGYMRVLALAPPKYIVDEALWVPPPREHPHFHGESWEANNCIWFGEGTTANQANDSLRLTDPLEKRRSRWRSLDLVRNYRPSYIGKDWRWREDGTFDAKGQWQEAVCNIGDAAEPRRWLNAIISEIEG